MLARTFKEITGIPIDRDIVHECEVVRGIAEPMMVGQEEEQRAARPKFQGRMLPTAVYLLAVLLCITSFGLRPLPAQAREGAVSLTPEEQQWLSTHAGSVRIGITVIPPQVIRHDGEYEGLSIDYIRLVERKLGVRFNLVPFATWNEVIQAARERRIDMIFAAQETPERRGYLLFTAPYIELQNVILTRTDRKGGSDLSEMKGWTVATSEGSAVHEYLKTKFPYLDLLPVPDELTGLMRVSLGEADAMVVEISRASYYIEAKGILNLRVSGDAGLPYRLRFAVRNDWPLLSDILNKGLSSVTDDEQRDITRRWIAVEEKSVFARTAFWISLASVLGVIALAVAASRTWTRTLRHRVKESTERLRTLNEELDRRVQERTAELAARNEALQRTDTELIREREFGRALLESMADGVVACDAEGTLALFNRKAREWHGVDPMRLPPEEWASHYDLFRADGVTPLPTGEIPLAMAFNGEEVKDAGMAIVARGQAPRFIVANGSIIRGADGRKLGAVVVMRDVTALRSLEQELRRTNEELEKRVADRTARLEEAARSLKEAQRLAHIGSWELDLTTNALTWSDEIFRIFEIDPEKFGASYESFLNTIHPDDREAVNAAYTKSLEDRTPYSIEHRLLFPDGRIKHVHEQCETYYDDGTPLRSMGTVQDITERKRAEDELARYRGSLEETVEKRTAELRLALDAADTANKAKSVFLANMSHELRTPLNAILGFSAMLRQDSQLSAAQAESLDIINRSGEHLLSLINDVLEMAKIEAGRVQMEMLPFDLGAMVRDVTDMMRLRAEQKGLFLKLDQSSQFPRAIRGDAARLRQILVNLVGNAVKFTKVGGVTLRLGVKPNERQHLLIEVEDSGPGIGPEDQARIFRPFVQLAEGGEQKGTGLGLTITKQFVGLMGGSIAVESALGTGSSFRVELPVELAELPETESGERGEVAGPAPGQPARRILIAEDQEDSALLLAKLMSGIGQEVKTAQNGEQCVRLFQDWQPDLIWMDRRMPFMDGIEATRRIRQLPGGKEVKIVAVTASAFREQQQEMLAAGMDDFVIKPYRFDDIYDCLARQLGLKYVYRSRAAAAPTPPLPTTRRVAALPEALRRDLAAALERLDSERIAKLLERVTAQDEDVGRALSHLVDGFDYPAVLRLLGRDGEPAVDESAASGAAEEVTEALRRQFPDQRVLVVDDDPANRELTQRLLHQVWPDIDTAEDGEGAVMAEARRAHDIILMDMHLPGIDGIEAARRIRALPGGQNTLIVALTADVSATEQARILAAGLNDVIKKTPRIDEFHANILKALRDKQDASAEPAR